MRNPIPVMLISGGNLVTLIFASHASQKMAVLCFSQLVHEFGIPNPFFCMEICVGAALCDFSCFHRNSRKKCFSCCQKHQNARFGHAAKKAEPEAPHCDFFAVSCKFRVK